MAATAKQENWRFCKKCLVLFWAGAQESQPLVPPGVSPPPATRFCPAGGAHDGSGSWNFILPADANDFITT